MSILNGVVAMNIDCTSAGYEEPSTPSKDPTSSSAIHIQWQNSQSACAAMEELRVASSVPRRPPQPLTFGFELAASARPSSSPSVPSDPFLLPSRTRTRMRSVRPRPLGRVHNQGQQSHSQNDVLAIPATDASKFLDMLGRASARVDENSRKRMKAAARARESESELHVFDECARGPVQRSSLKGKGRMRASTTTTSTKVVVTRSMDELGDHTNLCRDGRATDVPHSSLPMMRSKDPLSQPDHTMRSTMMRAADKVDDDGDVHMVMHTSDAASDALPPGDDHLGVITIEPPVSTSTDPQNGTHHFPPRPAAPLTRHPPQKQLELPSLTPARPAPTPPPIASRVPMALGPSLPSSPAAFAAESSSGGGSTATLMTSRSRSPLSRRCTSTTTNSTSATSTSTSIVPALPASQAHGSRRALGMTRIVPPSSTPQPQYSSAVKRPFRPPLPKPATVSRVSPSIVTAAATRPARNRQGGDAKEGAGADPDSSFDISFDFDPEALEAAMKKYD